MKTLTQGRTSFPLLLIAIVANMLLSGCTSFSTFPAYARAGDTVTIPLGDEPNMRRSNVTVNIKTFIPGCTGTIQNCTTIFTTLSPGNTAIRTLVNLYPDPISNLVVGGATNQDFAGQESNWGFDINTLSGRDYDWAETMLFFDLPTNITDNIVYIDVLDGASSIVSNTQIDILPGQGSPDDFVSSLGPLSADRLGSLERSTHYIVAFTGATVPHAIQVTMSHDPDLIADPQNGAGITYVAGGRSAVKSTTWSDDGTTLKVILIPAGEVTPSRIEPYKFYVAGGIINLQLVSVEAFDIDGNTVTGVNATITPNS